MDGGLVLLQGALHICSQDGKSVHALCLHMSDLRFSMETSFDSPNDDLSDDAFIWASKTIEGQDVMEEFVVCVVWSLAAGVSFDQVSISVTSVSKLKVPLPKFVAAHRDGEDDAEFLARVELQAKVIVGSYAHLEHNACIAGLQNNGCLNRVLELMGVANEPHPMLGSDASTEVSKKRKVHATGKAPLKCLRVPGKKGVETAETFVSQGKTSLK
jgi:hypothetical protein